MITDADVRRIALSMPEAEEKAHFGRPDFRVKNKIFVTIRPAKNYVVVKLSLADQSALVAMDPKAFSVNSWSHPGWTNVYLKHITKAQLRNVVQTAWCTVAPKKLVASYEIKNGHAQQGHQRAVRRRTRLSADGLGARK